jgi:hypothetical protein
VDLTARFLNPATPPEVTPDQVEPVGPPLEGTIKTGPVMHQTRLKDDKVLELVADYMSGLSAKEVARQYRMHEATVHEHLNRLDVPRHTYRKLFGERLQEAIGLYNGGMSLRKVANHLGVTPDTARRRLVEAGVTIRGRT